MWQARGQKCHAKGSRKEIQYKSKCIKIQRMCNMKLIIIPVINGATRILTKGLKKNLEAITGKHSLDSLPTTAIKEHHT
jgi:c-di-GMP-binding flagellar brake protein YcgR